MTAKRLHTDAPGRDLAVHFTWPVVGCQFGDYLDIRLPGVWVRVIRRDDTGFTMDIFPFIATVEWAPEPTSYVIVKTINLL